MNPVQVWAVNNSSPARVVWCTTKLHSFKWLVISLHRKNRRQQYDEWKEVRKEICDLTTHSIHFIYGYMVSDIWLRTILIVRKEGRKCFIYNDALNTFYLRSYGVRHMVKDHSDSERGNLLLPHGLPFPIDSKGPFICTIPQTG